MYMEGNFSSHSVIASPLRHFNIKLSSCTHYETLNKQNITEERAKKKKINMINDSAIASFVFGQL